MTSKSRRYQYYRYFRARAAKLATAKKVPRSSRRRDLSPVYLERMVKAMAIDTTMGTGSPSARRAGPKRHC